MLNLLALFITALIIIILLIGNIHFRREIKRRQEAESAMRESQQRLADIIEFLPDATFVIDRKGKVITWNHAIEEMSGIKAEQMLGRGDYEYALAFYDKRRPILIDLALHPDAEMEKLYKNVQRTGNILYAESNVTKLEEGRAYFFGVATTLRDSQGEIVGAIESVRDITQRMLESEALRAEKERFHLLVEEAPLGVSIIKADGSYQYVNPRFMELFGYTLADVPTGREWFTKAYADPEYRNQAITSWKASLKTLKSGRTREHIFKVRCKDGSEKIIYFRAVTMTTGDQLVIYDDLTERQKAEEERKRLEEQLRQAQKMEALGTLAGGIAHDFNNILSIILAHSELALEGLRKDDSAGQHLDHVIKASERAADLVKQILTFSRQTKIERRPLNLSVIIKEALTLLRAILPSTIELKEQVEIDFGPVLADPTQIQQVLMNLCGNAAQAMRLQGGTLVIKLSRFELGDKTCPDQPDLPPGQYLKLVVQDTGPGMDEETKSRLFDPFYTTKEQGEGTGLGLSVVHGIIIGHGGGVEVISQPGQGATFNIYLPVYSQGFEEEIKEEQMLPRGAGHILFVDDEDELISAGQDILEYLGYQVTGFTSSLEALDTFRSKPYEFDLVITDQIMPKMSGLELAKELTAIHPNIPILLCTGYSQQALPDTTKESGIKKVILKPYTLRKMAEAVWEVLNWDRMSGWDPRWSSG